VSTPLTPATVQQVAQTAATSPAHLDPQVVQQVCQEWMEQRALLRDCVDPVTFAAECCDGDDNYRNADAALVERITALTGGEK